ncbi:hypothetical protein MRX96_037729 [Rhipicephalus microplus]
MANSPCGDSGWRSGTGNGAFGGGRSGDGRPLHPGDAGRKDGATPERQRRKKAAPPRGRATLAPPPPADDARRLGNAAQ